MLHKISSIEKIYGYEGREGGARFSVENFLSHNAEKIRPLCFRKVLVQPFCAVFQKSAGSEKVYG